MIKIPKLTSEQKKLLINIQFRQKEISRLQGLLQDLRAQCKSVRGHIIILRDLNIDEQLKTDKWASTGALCFVCGERFGWWCPKSPDHICHYNEEKRDEWCIYCGMPEERK